MVDILDTIVDLPDTMVDLPDTMVVRPGAIVDIFDTLVDIPDTMVDLPGTMILCSLFFLILSCFFFGLMLEMIGYEGKLAYHDQPRSIKTKHD